MEAEAVFHLGEPAFPLPIPNQDQNPEPIDLDDLKPVNYAGDPA